MILPAPDKEPWATLMQGLLDGTMDGPAFQDEFLAASRVAVARGERVPYAADLMFYEVDAYCADPALRGEADLDEAGLRDAARRLITRLDEPWPKLPGTPSDEQIFENFRRAADSLLRRGK